MKINGFTHRYKVSAEVRGERCVLIKEVIKKVTLNISYNLYAVTLINKETTFLKKPVLHFLLFGQPLLR